MAVEASSPARRTPHQTPRAHRPTASERTATARPKTREAFALLGLLRDGPLHGCPRCDTTSVARTPKTAIFEDGGFHCRRCGAVGGPAVKRDEANRLGSAIDLLLSAGWSFSDAVALLNGEPASDGTKPPDVTDVETVAGFTATVDVELYNAVLANGDVDAACDFYGRFGISPKVVRESRAVRVVDQVALASMVKHRFGASRAIAAGLATEKGWLLVNSDYPVVEPHLTPAGLPAGLQFRASESTEKLVAAHKAGVGDYVPKFLSLRGAPPASRLGFGLEALSAASRGSKVWVVEGFKDLLAARTMGLNAYGLPGAGTLPVAAVARLLAGFKTVVIAFDADAGGDAGRENLDRYLRGFGAAVEHRRPPDGQDMADVLAARVAAGWAPPH